MNNDGLLDVGYGMHHNYSATDFGDQLIEVALGDGTGRNWIPWDDGLATNGETWGMFCTDFADVDLDGDLDLASNSFGASAGIHVYLNMRDGTWVQSWGFLGGNSDMDLTFGDVDGDGIPDFAAAHQNGTVYRGDGAGGFAVIDGTLPGTASSRTGPALGDVDGDGADELSFCTTAGGVQVWKLVHGTTWTSLSTGLPTSGSFSFTQLCDMNVDGHVDLVAFGGGLVKVWAGDGAGGWTEAASFATPTPSSAQAFRVGVDCDHNGYPDIALVALEGNWPNDRNRLRFFKETSISAEPFIFPLEPSPNRRWIGGSVRTITWTSTVPEDAPGSVDLPNNGSHQLIVPDGLTSTRCWIRYTLRAGPGEVRCTSRGAFSIVPSPTCKIPQVVATLEGGQLLLTWAPIPGVAAFHVYRGETPFFTPDTLLFTNRVAVLDGAQTSYSSPYGVGNPGVNATYRILSIDATGNELGRSSPVGEEDFPAEIQ